MPRLTLLPLPGHPQHDGGAPDGACAFVAEVERGVRVLDAASAMGVLVATRCGGVADCQSCRVEPEPGSAAALSAIEASERLALDEAGAKPNERLACQARVLDDATLYIRDPALLEAPFPDDPSL